MTEKMTKQRVSFEAHIRKKNGNVLVFVSELLRRVSTNTNIEI